MSSSSAGERERRREGGSEREILTTNGQVEKLVKQLNRLPAGTVTTCYNLPQAVATTAATQYATRLHEII